MNVCKPVSVSECVWNEITFASQNRHPSPFYLLAMRIINSIQSKPRQAKPVECKQLQGKKNMLQCKWINENMQIE